MTRPIRKPKEPTVPSPFAVSVHDTLVSAAVTADKAKGNIDPKDEESMNYIKSSALQCRRACDDLVAAIEETFQPA